MWSNRPYNGLLVSITSIFYLFTFILASTTPIPGTQRIILENGAKDLVFASDCTITLTNNNITDTTPVPYCQKLLSASAFGDFGAALISTRSSETNAVYDTSLILFHLCTTCERRISFVGLAGVAMAGLTGGLSAGVLPITQESGFLLPISTGVLLVTPYVTPTFASDCAQDHVSWVWEEGGVAVTTSDSECNVGASRAAFVLVPTLSPPRAAASSAAGAVFTLEPAPAPSSVCAYITSDVALRCQLVGHLQGIHRHQTVSRFCADSGAVRGPLPGQACLLGPREVYPVGCIEFTGQSLHSLFVGHDELYNEPPTYNSYPLNLFNPCYDRFYAGIVSSSGAVLTASLSSFSLTSAESGTLRSALPSPGTTSSSAGRTDWASLPSQGAEGRVAAAHAVLQDSSVSPWEFQSPSMAWLSGAVELAAEPEAGPDVTPVDWPERWFAPDDYFVVVVGHIFFMLIPLTIAGILFEIYYVKLTLRALQRLKTRLNTAKQAAAQGFNDQLVVRPQPYMPHLNPHSPEPTLHSSNASLTVSESLEPDGIINNQNSTFPVFLQVSDTENEVDTSTQTNISENSALPLAPY